MSHGKLIVATACVALTVGTVRTGVFAADTPVPPAVAPAHQWKHPEMHKALHSLRAARLALETAAHDFAGHRKAATKLTDEAVKEVVAALKIDNDLPEMPTTKPSVPPTDVEDKAEAQKQMREARRTLETAQTELKASAHDFEGHRTKALKLAAEAIQQVDEGLAASK